MIITMKIRIGKNLLAILIQSCLIQSCFSRACLIDLSANITEAINIMTLITLHAMTSLTNEPKTLFNKGLFVLKKKLIANNINVI